MADKEKEVKALTPEQKQKKAEARHKKIYSSRRVVDKRNKR